MKCSLELILSFKDLCVLSMVKVHLFSLRCFIRVSCVNKSMNQFIHLRDSVAVNGMEKKKHLCEPIGSRAEDDRRLLQSLFLHSLIDTPEPQEGSTEQWWSKSTSDDWFISSRLSVEVLSINFTGGHLECRRTSDLHYEVQLIPNHLRSSTR